MSDNKELLNDHFAFYSHSDLRCTIIQPQETLPKNKPPHNACVMRSLLSCLASTRSNETRCMKCIAVSEQITSEASATFFVSITYLVISSSHFYIISIIIYKPFALTLLNSKRNNLITILYL